MSINCPHTKLRDEIERTIRKAVPSESDIAMIAGQLRKHEADPASEAIVESYYRCLLVDHLQKTYRIEQEEVPLCINSSHRAPRLVCCATPRHRHYSIEKERWLEGWWRMRDRYTPIRRHETLRRADLYVIGQEQIVSVEFKYAGLHGIRDPSHCIEQMKRYVIRHAATMMVVYAALKPDSDVRGVADVRRALGPATPVVVVYGLQIPKG